MGHMMGYGLTRPTWPNCGHGGHSGYGGMRPICCYVYSRPIIRSVGMMFAIVRVVRYLKKIFKKGNYGYGYGGNPWSSFGSYGSYGSSYYPSSYSKYPSSSYGGSSDGGSYQRPSISSY